MIYRYIRELNLRSIKKKILDPSEKWSCCYVTIEQNKIKQ